MSVGAAMARRWGPSGLGVMLDSQTLCRWRPGLEGGLQAICSRVWTAVSRLRIGGRRWAGRAGGGSGDAKGASRVLAWLGAGGLFGEATGFGSWSCCSTGLAPSSRDVGHQIPGFGAENRSRGPRLGGLRLAAWPVKLGRCCALPRAGRRPALPGGRPRSRRACGQARHESAGDAESIAAEAAALRLCLRNCAGPDRSAGWIPETRGQSPEHNSAKQQNK